MLPTYVQACHDVSQLSVENRLTPSRGARSRSLLKSPSHLIVGGGVRLHATLLVCNASPLAFVLDVRSFELVWEVAEQREGTAQTLRIVEPAQVSCSVLTQFGELHRDEARRQLMVCHALSDNSETILFQRLCEHCRVQLGCVIVSYSSGPSTLSRWNAGQSAGIYQLDFSGMLYGANVCSSLQKEVRLASKMEKMGFTEGQESCEVRQGCKAAREVVSSAECCLYPCSTCRGEEDRETASTLRWDHGREKSG